MSLSDAALMDRWRRRSDAEAFSEVVSRHAGMVYGTCRRLLGDSEAEDMAQECFIKLSQSDLRHGHSVGGWLHTVATNACLDRLRSANRRRVREEIFETTKEPSEVGWDDLQQHVDEAIAALPDDLREPIIAHFLDGQTHQEVAAALHLTRSGVTRRIQRGIEAIRETLKARGVVVPAAVLSALLAENAALAAPATVTTALAKLALAGAGAHATAGAGVSWAGWLTAKAAVTLLVGGSVLGGGAWYVASRIPSEAAVEPVAQVAETPPAPEKLAQADAAAEPEAAPTETVGIEVIVTSPEGYPRPDVQFARAFTNDLWYSPTSDVQGLVMLPPEAAGQRWVAYTHVFEKAALFEVPLTQGDEPIRVVLEYGVRPFYGRVVDAAGKGVPLAHVEVSGTTAGGVEYTLGIYPADVNGFYATKELPVADGLWLQARVVPPGKESPGAWSEPMILNARPHSLLLPELSVTEATAENIAANQTLEGWMERLESRLREQPKAEEYGGVILDTEGGPVVGANVEVMYTPREGFLDSVHAGTGADGRWNAWLSADLSSAELRIQHPDYVGTVLVPRFESPPLERLKEGTAVTKLARGIVLSGVIRDPSGAPVADALVLPHASYARNAGGPEPTANAPIEDDYSVRTSPDGSFAMRGLPAGENMLQVMAAGYAPCVRPVPVASGMVPVSIELDEGGTIHGRIVDSTGSPIPGAYVYGDEWRLDKQYEYTARAEADEQGSFTLRNVPLDGVVSFSFGVERGKSDRKLMGMSSDVLMPREAPYEVVMYEAPLFSGTVVDDVTGAPITAFRAKTGWRSFGQNVIGWNEMAGEKEVSDEGGRFEVATSRFHAQWPSTLEFFVGLKAKGYCSAVAPPLQLGGKVEALEIRLTRGTPWIGQVRQSNGEAAAGAKVAWIGPDRRAFVVNGQLDTDFTTTPEEVAECDAEGRFELPPSADQGFLFAIHESGYAWRASEDFERGSDLALTPWARVEGKVRRAGAVLPDVPINAKVLKSDDEEAPPIDWILNTSTHVDGRYEFTHVPTVALSVGYWVIGDRHGEMSHTRLVAPEPGKTHQIDLGTASGAAEGRIAPGDGKALAGFRDALEKKVVIAVAERRMDNETVPGDYKEEYVPVLEPDGRIRLDGLVPGDYHLRIEVRTPSPNMGCGVGRALWTGNQEFTVLAGESGVAKIPDVVLEATPVPVAGDLAPDLMGWTFAKDEFNLEKLRGQWVLLDFWAMWCPPCRNGMLRLKPLWSEFGATGKVAFVGVNFDGETDGAMRFTEEQGLLWTQFSAEAWGPENVVLGEWGLTAIPSICLIDPEGKIVARDLDLAGAEKLLRGAVGH